MTMRKWISECGCGLCLLTASVLSGCGDNGLIDELNVLEDCEDVCSKYDECVSETDISDCTDRCEDDTDSTPEGMERLDDCAGCLEERSCAEGTLCIPQCSFIDPSTVES
jgi:hypothetical protein